MAGDKETGEKAALFAADVYMTHIRYLASDKLEGRLPGTPGIELAAEYIERHFKEAGLKPGGVEGTYFQPFQVKSRKDLHDDRAALSIDGLADTWKIREDWMPMATCPPGAIEGPLAFAGYGLEVPKSEPRGSSGSEASDDAVSKSDDAADKSRSKNEEPQPGYSDYENFDASGKILLIFRYEPKSSNPKAPYGGESPSSYSMFVNKARVAAEKGAKALLIVNPPGRGGDEDLYPWNEREERSTYKVPLAFITPALAEKLLKAGGVPDMKTLQEQIDGEHKPHSQDMQGLRVKLDPGISYIETRNVIGVLPGEGAADEYIVVGAHYDHLGNVPRSFGFGGGSGDKKREIHNGADDNASGTAGIIELARAFAEGPRPRRSIVFMAFAAEEMGLLGSFHYVEHPTVELTKIKAMLNLDMIGRLGAGAFTINGVSTAREFRSLVQAAGEELGVQYTTPPTSDRFFGASDHFPFYRKGIPVLFAFTGVHKQYHKPEDDWERIDADGATRVLQLYYTLTREVANMTEGPTVMSKEEQANDDASNISRKPEEKADRDSGEKKDESTPRMPRVRLGVMPSYSDTGPGMLIEGVQAGGAADKGGMRDGDRILKIGDKDVADIYGYMEALGKVKPDQEIDVVVERKKEKITLKIKLQAPPAAGRDPH